MLWVHLSVKVNGALCLNYNRLPIAEKYEIKIQQTEFQLSLLRLVCLVQTINQQESKVKLRKILH